jgi:hypothetical protein
MKLEALLSSPEQALKGFKNPDFDFARKHGLALARVVAQDPEIAFGVGALRFGNTNPASGILRQKLLRELPPDIDVSLGGHTVTREEIAEVMSLVVSTKNGTTHLPRGRLYFLEDDAFDLIVQSVASVPELAYKSGNHLEKRGSDFYRVQGWLPENFKRGYSMLVEGVTKSEMWSGFALLDWEGLDGAMCETLSRAAGVGSDFKEKYNSSRKRFFLRNCISVTSPREVDALSEEQLQDIISTYDAVELSLGKKDIDLDLPNWIRNPTKKTKLRQNIDIFLQRTGEGWSSDKFYFGIFVNKYGFDKMLAFSEEDTRTLTNARTFMAEMVKKTPILGHNFISNPFFVDSIESGVLSKLVKDLADRKREYDAPGVGPPQNYYGKLREHLVAGKFVYASFSRNDFDILKIADLTYGKPEGTYLEMALESGVMPEEVRLAGRIPLSWGTDHGAFLIHVLRKMKNKKHLVDMDVDDAEAIALFCKLSGLGKEFIAAKLDHKDYCGSSYVQASINAGKIFGQLDDDEIGKWGEISGELHHTTIPVLRNLDLTNARLAARMYDFAEAHTQLNNFYSSVEINLERGTLGRYLINLEEHFSNNDVIGGDNYERVFRT